MPDTKLETAINGVSDSVDKSSMGIKGLLWNNVGNMAAMAIIAGAFLYLGQDFMTQAKEDRVMFRDELKAIRKSQEDRWEKTDITHGRAMEKMGTTVERAVTSMENATKVLERTASKITGPPGH